MKIQVVGSLSIKLLFQNHLALMQDEIFGPILPVLKVNNQEDAIEKINERPKVISCLFFQFMIFINLV